MLKDEGAAAASPCASWTAVLTDGGAVAGLTSGSSAAVLTDGGATAAFAFASSAVVLTDARPPVVLADAIRILGTGSFCDYEGTCSHSAASRALFAVCLGSCLGGQATADALSPRSSTTLTRTRPPS